MCGIVGYVGKRQATSILLQGLEKLEYRGYDSVGIAVQNYEIRVVKARGRLENLLSSTSGLTGSCGIGHTRWATHGEPSEINAHPHQSSDGKVVLVHNGILENYAEIKGELETFGYVFCSQTDTEVIANFLARRVFLGDSPTAALRVFMKRARGSYALSVLFQDFPNRIYAVRKDSPLIVGVGEGETCLASDVSALLALTNQIYYVDDREIVVLTNNQAIFLDEQGENLSKMPTKITWSADNTEKGSYPHFMLKEIYEQPQAIRNTLFAIKEMGLKNLELTEIERLYIVACGSAYHAGVVMANVVERLAEIPVRVALASEFRYEKPLLTDRTLVVIISQSGETADSLAALRRAKERGVKTLAIVNVRGSSIDREADRVLYTMAGPEVAVATTKAYSTQLLVGYLFALELAKAHNRMTEEQYARLYRELYALPQKMEEILQKGEELKRIARRLTGAASIFFIGRGMDYAVSLEGSLKMKEISYIHSESYAAGELKHGTLSLIEEGVWTVATLTQSPLTEKTLSNIMEVKSRGGKVFVIVSEGIPVGEIADEMIVIPKIEELFSASLAVIPLQLLSYFVSVERGLDIDKPRNLAKSVTVE